MTDLDINNEHVMKYVCNSFGRSMIDSMKFDVVDETVIFNIKRIINNYLTYGKSAGSIPDNVVLVDVTKNSQDDTQVEIIFGRGYYRYPIYM